MISYLEAIKPLVNPEIYNRGLKLYLEGRVLGYSELLLDYWRRYQVQGKHQVYTVDIPLIHLALDKSKHSQAGEALQQVVRSDSAYFLEFGLLCANVVAVCAALDQEFGLNSTPNKPALKPASLNLWDNLLVVEISKKQREWLQALEFCLLSGGLKQKRYYQLLQQYFPDLFVPSPQPGLFKEVQDLIKTVVGDYSKEKNLRQIFTDPYFLATGGLVWWQLFAPYLSQLDPHNQLLIYLDLWQNRLAGNTTEFESELQNYFINLSSQQKEQILQELQTQFGSKQPQVWLEFAFWCQHTSWLWQQVDSLDSRYLIRLAQLLPDHRELIEQKMVKQLKIWSDFLPVGDYQELVSVLSEWKAQLGRSDYLQEVIGYIQANHPKKTKLIREVEKI